MQKINIDGFWYSELDLKLEKPQENMKLESTRELSNIVYVLIFQVILFWSKGQNYLKIMCSFSLFTHCINDY